MVDQLVHGSQGKGGAAEKQLLFPATTGDFREKGHRQLVGLSGTVGSTFGQDFRREQIGYPEELEFDRPAADRSGHVYKTETAAEILMVIAGDFGDEKRWHGMLGADLSLGKINEFVIAGVTELIKKPNPFRRIEKRFAGQRPALKVEEFRFVSVTFHHDELLPSNAHYLL